MGRLQSGTQFGQRRNHIYDQPPLAPISHGLDVFGKGFSMVRNIYDDFANLMGDVPFIGPGLEYLLDNPAMAEVLGVFDLLHAGTDALKPIFETIEGYTDPILREALKEMGLNVPNQLTEEDIRALEGSRGIGNLAPEAQLNNIDDVSAMNSTPAIFVPLNPTDMASDFISTR
jgi:hypothetical protein